MVTLEKQPDFVEFLGLRSDSIIVGVLLAITLHLNNDKVFLEC